MAPVARNLADSADGFLRDKKFPLLDNDKLFTQQSCRILGDAGCELVRTAYQAPNMNAFAERFVKTVKRECLRKMILFGDRQLRKVLHEFAGHYHGERPHHGLGNKLILPRGDQPPSGDKVIADARLGHHGWFDQGIRKAAA